MPSCARSSEWMLQLNECKTCVSVLRTLKLPIPGQDVMCVHHNEPWAGPECLESAFQWKCVPLIHCELALQLQARVKELCNVLLDEVVWHHPQSKRLRRREVQYEQLSQAVRPQALPHLYSNMQRCRQCLQVEDVLVLWWTTASAVNWLDCPQQLELPRSIPRPGWEHPFRQRPYEVDVGNDNVLPVELAVLWNWVQCWVVWRWFVSSKHTPWCTHQWCMHAQCSQLCVIHCWNVTLALYSKMSIRLSQTHCKMIWI